MDCSLPGSSVHGNSPGKNTGVGCHALFQGIFPTQGLNPSLLLCRQILYLLSHQGSPITADIDIKVRRCTCEFITCYIYIVYHIVYYTLLFRVCMFVYIYPHICCLLLFSVISDSFVTPWTIAHQALLSMDNPGKNTGVGCHFLLQGIFLTQGSNPHVLHWQVGSYHWATNHQGSLYIYMKPMYIYEAYICMCIYYITSNFLSLSCYSYTIFSSSYLEP